MAFRHKFLWKKDNFNGQRLPPKRGIGVVLKQNLGTYRVLIPSRARLGGSFEDEGTKGGYN